MLPSVQIDRYPYSFSKRPVLRHIKMQIQVSLYQYHYLALGNSTWWNKGLLETPILHDTNKTVFPINKAYSVPRAFARSLLTNAKICRLFYLSINDIYQVKATSDEERKAENEIANPKEAFSGMKSSYNFENLENPW